MKNGLEIRLIPGCFYDFVSKFKSLDLNLELKFKLINHSQMNLNIIQAEVLFKPQRVFPWHYAKITTNPDFPAGLSPEQNELPVTINVLIQPKPEISDFTSLLRELNPKLKINAVITVKIKEESGKSSNLEQDLQIPIQNLINAYLNRQF